MTSGKYPKTVMQAERILSDIRRKSPAIASALSAETLTVEEIDCLHVVLGIGLADRNKKALAKLCALAKRALSPAAVEDDALKNCPFCGGPATLIPMALNVAFGKHVGISAQCTRCFVETASCSDGTIATAAWNRRAPAVEVVWNGKNRRRSLDEIVAQAYVQPPAAEVGGETP